MTQEFVTLPREVVEQVRGALAYVGAGNSSENPNLAQSTCRQAIWKLDHALRAELEQPDHSEQNLNMIPAGWKLVPDEPTCGMVLAGEHSMKQHDFFRLDAGYRAMLAAAPQPQTTEQSSAVEQQQGEQEPVAWIWTEWSSRKLTFDGPPAVPSVRDELTKPVWTPLYTHPQPKREPLSTARIDELIEEGIFGGNPYELVRRLEEERGVFMTRPLTDEQIDRIIADLAPVFLDTPTGFEEDFCRAIEAAHNIK